MKAALVLLMIAMMILPALIVIRIMLRKRR